jgi:hypothetical protein
VARRARRTRARDTRCHGREPIAPTPSTSFADRGLSSCRRSGQRSPDRVNPPQVADPSGWRVYRLIYVVEHTGHLTLCVTPAMRPGQWRRSAH